MSKDTILSNLKLLHEAVSAFPEERLDLESFKREEPCGTLFCTAGLAASMPEFQAQGMHFEAEPHPLVPSSVWWRVKIGDSLLWDEEADSSVAADELFGKDSANTLFAERGQGDCDDEFFDDDYSVTDKQLALMRIETQIEFVESQA